MRILFFLAFLFMIFSCKDSVDINYVKSKMWSYEKGFKVGQGDIIVFDDKHKIFEIKGDTIYFNNNPRAIIRNVSKKNFQMRF